MNAGSRDPRRGLALCATCGLGVGESAVREGRKVWCDAECGSLKWCTGTGRMVERHAPTRPPPTGLALLGARLEDLADRIEGVAEGIHRTRQRLDAWSRRRAEALLRRAKRAERDTIGRDGEPEPPPPVDPHHEALRGAWGLPPRERLSGEGLAKILRGLP